MRRYVRESWGELRKVQWPTRTQVAQGTLVVGIVTVFFAVYLTVLDYGMVRLVRQLESWIAG
jgi:preprotein translocase SecE subunit